MFFVSMDYKKHYDKLIFRGQTRNLNGYTERHHIHPKCMGGDDNKNNLVRLTPEEHYVAHQLLMKIYPNSSAIVRAAVMMRPNRPQNKLYGWIKRRFSEIQSERYSGQGNPLFGKKWIYSDDFKISKIIDNTDIIEDGWTLGRKINFELKVFELKCASCSCVFESKAGRKKFCSVECKNKSKPNIVLDNFEKLYKYYHIHGALYLAFKECGIGYTKSVYDRFFKIARERNLPILE